MLGGRRGNEGGEEGKEVKVQSAAELQLPHIIQNMQSEIGVSQVIAGLIQLSNNKLGLHNP